MKDTWFYTLQDEHWYPYTGLAKVWTPALKERMATDVCVELWGRVEEMLLQHQGIAITINFTQKESITDTGLRIQHTINLCSPVAIPELEGEQSKGMDDGRPTVLFAMDGTPHYRAEDCWCAVNDAYPKRCTACGAAMHNQAVYDGEYYKCDECLHEE